MDDYGNAIVVTGTAAPLKYNCRSVSPPSSVSSSCSPPPPPPPPPPPAVQVVVGNVAPTVVLSPCAACKILRRRCADGCVLAPYFPPTEPSKFTTAHRVFGASNIIKLLQDLPESSRADAVSSMVYEAEARLRDPVYGCAGAVCRLQRQANELKVQLARAQADLLSAQAQHADLLALFCVEMATPRQPAAAAADADDGGGRWRKRVRWRGEQMVAEKERDLEEGEAQKSPSKIVADSLSQISRSSTFLPNIGVPTTSKTGRSTSLDAQARMQAQFEEKLQAEREEAARKQEELQAQLQAQQAALEENQSLLRQTQEEVKGMHTKFEETNALLELS
ncbi:LOB domain-containing protein 1 [Zea mays]|uniref:LOB domain-containing protein 1 n=1 Tax=Zea mays TaxID=4577 RepID=A0A3L6DDL7_MAIZE|nr:LOB domain-containing protein 1 [Zea mays]